MQSVLITGCSSGIGAAVALDLHTRGYRVLATVRRTEDAMALQAQGLQTAVCDLNDENAIAALVLHAEQLFGRIDVLFNNAAYGQPGAVEDLSREVLRAQFETNVLGTQSLTNRVIAHMRRHGGGRILYNSSVLGFVAMAYRGAYNASKYALEALADTLRLELEGSGIFVSLIEPGPIESQFRANALQAFHSGIDALHSPHHATYARMIARLAQPGPVAPFTLPASALVKPVLHAIEAKRPKARYWVTVPTVVFALLKRLLSTRQLDRVLRAVSRRES